MQSCHGALERLCAPEHQVSAHYLIGRDGQVFQLVDEPARAWHAGAGRWGGVGDVNSRSIGIELDNDGATPFSAPLMHALETLLPGILQRWAIPPRGVIGHSDMAPGRKADPGGRFDWRRLALQGLAVWPGAPKTPPPPDPARFLALASRFGYDPAPGPDTILSAFRLRFRPWASGPLAAEDMAAVADLAQNHPA